MNSSQTGRVTLILIVLLACLFFIFPHPSRLLDHSLPWGEKTSLRPGIDMAGGTSLLYQIRPPAGGYHGQGQTLSEAVSAALKKRIDPNGIKNLIWRPIGADRLEIQIPASPENQQASVAQAAYLDATHALEATNVSPIAVRQAVELPAGPARQAKLDALAGGMPLRKQLFDRMAADQDAVAAAHAARNADAEARASDAYDRLAERVKDTNLQPEQVEAAIKAETPAEREAQLADLAKDAATCPGRAAALAAYVKAYDAYAKLRERVDDAAQLKRELQGSGLLEFHIVALPENGLTGDAYARMVEQLKAHGPRPQANDDLAWFQVDQPAEYHGGRTYEFNGKTYALCWITPVRSLVNGPNIKPWTMQQVGRSTDELGKGDVTFQFDAVGGLLFHDFTAANVHQQLAAILDRKIISSANINQAIGQSGVITGSFSDAELSYLVDTLNGGSLPGQLENEPISEQTVGPQLGQDNLWRGLKACGLGLVIVAIFLVGYYYLAGVVATVAVFMNVLLILGVLAAFGATFTLPGIAGIVLTIGAAVDANVLIFERLREEQHHGLGLRMALDAAYRHARSAILDSNATTVITSLILIWLGSEEVKGFGTTLLIGLLSSLFTSLFVTRTIFNILLDTFHVQNLGSFPLTFPKWDQILRPKWDWMRLVPYFLAFSLFFIVAGGVAFGIKARQGKLADVDFTGGTQVQFDLQRPMSLEAVRKVFADAHNPVLGTEPDLTGAGAGDVSYRLITPQQDAKAVRQAVLDVLGSRVTADLPSRFDHVGDPYEAARAAGAVLPVPADGLTVAGQKVPGTDEYIGGAAIVLGDLQPPLTLEAIRNRLEQQRAKSQAAGVDVPRDVTVVTTDTANADANRPVGSAVVLAAAGDYPFDRDAAKWATNVADPIWRVTVDAVTSGGTLQRVNNFDAQVAGATQETAYFALVLSAIVIMVYVWFRFGNLKYGLATVLAMLHDVALVVGAVGLSHYVGAVPWLSGLLMVEPFRVNLTIVAAVLTVMSYSMIDTIVVFDRIRENRGRFGHLSRQIVNDSINQTLSRTLLTAGTTLVTVTIMYIVGGPGIHGFTFVLLVGILVGTYSSIAIAAPILLTGVESRQSAGPRLPTRTVVAAGV